MHMAARAWIETRICPMKCLPRVLDRNYATLSSCLAGWNMPENAACPAQIDAVLNQEAAEVPGLLLHAGLISGSPAACLLAEKEASLLTTWCCVAPGRSPGARQLPQVLQRARKLFECGTEI